jgi:hypothetical protein
LRLFFALRRPVKVLKVPSEHHVEVRVESADLLCRLSRFLAVLLQKLAKLTCVALMHLKAP